MIWALETVVIWAVSFASIAKVEVACGETIITDANISCCTSDIVIFLVKMDS